MTQEDKDLLLKAICGYLPYALQVRNPHLGGPDYATGIDTETWKLQVLHNGYTDDIEKFKLYLRPMSSMTEEECKELGDLLATIENVSEVIPNVPYYIEVAKPEQINWLLEHHFDFYGLIEKNLAIAVTKENNPYKK